MKRRILSGEYVEIGYARHLARLFTSLSDVAVLRVLLALGDDEVSANHVADIVEMAPRDVQQCLEALEEFGLIRGTVYGRVRFFRIENDHLRNLLFGGVRTLAT